MPAHTETPKWKLKANWLLKEIIGIWQGYSEPESLFKDRNFICTFMHIMEQYLEDYGSCAPQAELDICIRKRRIIFATRHGSEPTFINQAREAEWIAEAVAIHCLQFELIKDDVIEMIIEVAYAIEDILKTCDTIPSDYLQTIDELLDRPVPNIHELPILPITKQE